MDTRVQVCLQQSPKLQTARQISRLWYSRICAEKGC